jgi:alpha-glutamyl/putrescinyl thymine pyrophosphorylase clade 1
MSLTIHDLKETEVFATYWRFPSGRHAIYERRLRGDPPPWTDDPIFAQYKFTNAFRAADRVSQYVIRDVIYESGGSMEDDEVVFRIILFKLFNSVGAWEALKAEVGIPSWRTFAREAYAKILTKAKLRPGGLRSGTRPTCRGPNAEKIIRPSTSATSPCSQGW